MEPVDLMALRDQGDLQPEQIGFEGEITWAYAKHLHARGGGLTGHTAERIVMIAGILEKWSGTGYAWALITSKAGPHMQEITARSRKYLQESEFPRIELIVGSSFQNGHRFALLLGLTRESEVMRKWRPDGGDVVLYARVQ